MAERPLGLEHEAVVFGIPGDSIERTANALQAVPEVRDLINPTGIVHVVRNFAALRETVSDAAWDDSIGELFHQTFLAGGAVKRIELPEIELARFDVAVLNPHYRPPNVKPEHRPNQSKTNSYSGQRKFIKVVESELKSGSKAPLPQGIDDVTVAIGFKIPGPNVYPKYDPVQAAEDRRSRWLHGL